MSKHTLKALTASAAAIPAISSAVAPDESVASYRYNSYSEADAPEERVYVGSTDRYDIAVHQFYLLQPINSQFVVSLEGTYESMSGASPMVTTKVDGEPDKAKMYMSGASITEQRFDIYGGARYYFKSGDLGTSIGTSQENDYSSYSVAVSGQVDIFDKLTNITGGVSMSSDTLTPTAISGDPEHTNSPGRAAAAGQKKTSISLVEGVTQVVNANLIVQMNGGITFKNGYLSDPYRELPGSDYLYDVRPDTKTMTTVSAGMRKYMPAQNAAIHGDYRFYWDTWGTASNTIELAWHQRFDVVTADGAGFMGKLETLGSGLSVAPFIRYYQQSAAGFYELADDPEVNPDFYLNTNKTAYSSDARLSQFGSINVGVRTKVNVGDFAVVGTVDALRASGPLGFNTTEEVPGVPSYFRMSMGIDYKF